MVTDHSTVGVARPGTHLGRPVRVNLALLRAFRRSPIEFVDLLVASGASARPLRVGSERMLLLDDPTQIWQLLTAHTRRTQKGRGLVRARLLLGDGLLTSEGEEHMRQRRALQAAFHSGRIADYLGCFAAAAQRAADRWSNGCEIDLVAEMSGLTLDGVGTALFGTDLRSSAPQVSGALADLLIGFRLAMAPGGVRLLRTPLPAARRVRRAKAELDDLVDDLVRRRNDQPAERPTVLDLLSDQPGFSDRQVRDQVMTLLLAGHETTAMALVWALAAIDQAPAVRDALEAEWDAGGKGNNDVPAGTSSSGQPPGTLPSATLPLTTAVLAETLRLWPPSWMFSRRLTEPLTLGGRTVSAGTMCLISPALLHRDARWWAEPNELRPYRWLRRESDELDRFDPKAPGHPRGAFLPFGAGPRMCIGEQFAWAEAAIVLAELGRNWRIHISPTPLSPGPSSMTLRPKDPVKATTSRRDMAFRKHA
ncbi:MAG TPA: cytochrome P450 [Propionibacteriaceae bacterium]|nr:cytochrome P450 [Propionibacteriaceae bacterium]